MGRPVLLVLGATSAIARASAMAFARDGYDLFLAGRDEGELARLASDLALRHGGIVRYGICDAEAYDSHPAFLDAVLAEMGGLTGVLMAIGYLGDQKAARHFDTAAAVIARNLTGPVSLLSPIADHLEASGSGFIIGISSVAGDRGRQGNYVYGAAKGGLSLYLQGLRNRLQPHGVRVLTIKPGFVDTAMTYGLPGLFLVASPQQVGEAIRQALSGKSDVVYLPWFWRYIMLIIRSIPEALFKRLKL